ncbi:MAG: isocitrate lyase/PEP mutase family protein [Proteobacteria bacterium]|nr:isocitrate lyase/PEP mutase family protein [Pseudomonadota bacterium]MDA0959887.1 isocitrate lyase/PEP mutase family protein [Pseudomonadota bacterium]
MNWTSRRQRFRQILQGTDCITPVTVFDPLSARMVEDLGGQVGMLAGSVAAMAILGAPDKMLITASEFADMALRICRAGDLAVIADADHGYGNAMNVQRTIRELDHAGLAAITIEDTDLPQPFGSVNAQLLSIEEGTGKMRAAVAGRVDPDLVILARTSAATITGRDDCIARIKAYAKTGVDGITLIGARSHDDLDALCAATDLPIMLGGLGSIAPTPDEAAKMGARICLRGHQPYLASLAATYSAIQQVLGENASVQKSQEAAPPVIDAKILRGLTREDAYDSDSEQFLK